MSLPPGAKITAVRSRIKQQNFDLDQVDKAEEAKVRNVVEDVFDKFGHKLPDLRVYAKDQGRLTEVSIMGWNDFVSIPDYCAVFHAHDRDPKYQHIVDTLLNPLTSEMIIHIEKSNAMAAARPRLKTRVPVRNIDDDDDDDDLFDDEMEDYYRATSKRDPPKRRPYIPK